MRNVLLMLCVYGGTAWADTGELSLRPSVQLRHGAIAGPDDATGDAHFSIGAGVVASYGLSFSSAITLRYGYEDTGTVTEAIEGRLERLQWAQRRHAGWLGVSWTHSDEWTPVLQAELGGAYYAVRSPLRLSPDGLTIETLDEASGWQPAARVSASYEWRFTDFMSVAPGVFAEHAGGWGVGGTVWLGVYRYL